MPAFTWRVLMVYALWRLSSGTTPGSAPCRQRHASDRRTGQQGGGASRNAGGALLSALIILALGGCARDPVQTPIAWWHGLQGGAIAAQRPPPPGQNLPYPQLGTTPSRPPLPDALTRDRLREDLAAQREAAVRRAARNPIVVVQAARPTPGPTPPPEASNATLVAAEPPPTPAAPNAAAPVAAAPPQHAPAPAPSTAAAVPVAAPPPAASPAGTSPPPSAGGLTLAGSTADTGVSLPTIAAAPPTPADFEGVPAFPQPSAPPPVPAYVPSIARGTQLGFAPGSDQLANSSRGALHALSARRGAGAIVITGYGDASSDQPDAQLLALDLGLRRARTVASALAGEGVPTSALRIDAAAFGRGASALLIN